MVLEQGRNTTQPMRGPQNDLDATSDALPTAHLTETERLQRVIQDAIQAVSETDYLKKVDAYETALKEYIDEIDTTRLELFQKSLAQVTSAIDTVVLIAAEELHEIGTKREVQDSFDQAVFNARLARDDAHTFYSTDTMMSLKRMTDAKADLRHAVGILIGELRDAYTTRDNSKLPGQDPASQI